MEQFTGANEDQYTGQGKIWEIAKRHNDESKRLHGEVTVRRQKYVKQCERVGVL